MDELRPVVDELVSGWILPMSGDEYADIEAEAAISGIEVSIDAVSGKPSIKKAAESGRLGVAVMASVVSKRLRSVDNYAGLEAELGPDGGVIYDDTGEIRTKASPISEGAEWVRFVLEEAEEAEREILADFFTAIRSMSHLDRGLLKISGLRCDSNTPGTQASGGSARSVDPDISPERTIPPKTTQGSPATATEIPTSMPT